MHQYLNLWLMLGGVFVFLVYAITTMILGPY